MLKMNDGDHVYDLIETDPFQWLEAAEGAKESSEILWVALNQLREKPPAESRVQMLGVMRGCMLLMAVSLECLCKALQLKPSQKAGETLAGEVVTLSLNLRRAWSQFQGKKLI
jgi:hypothetical protein